MNNAQEKQFIAFHDVRGALVTATASLTSGTATSLVSGDTANYLDLVELTCANNSGAAANVILTNDGSTIRTFEVPPYTTLFKYDVPVEQITKGTGWSVDMEDITGTTVTIDALFVKR